MFQKTFNRFQVHLQNSSEPGAGDLPSPHLAIPMPGDDVRERTLSMLLHLRVPPACLDIHPRRARILRVAHFASVGATQGAIPAVRAHPGLLRCSETPNHRMRKRLSTGSTQPDAAGQCQMPRTPVRARSRCAPDISEPPSAAGTDHNRGGRPIRPMHACYDKG